MKSDTALLQVAVCNQLHGATSMTHCSRTEFEGYEFPISEGPLEKEVERLKQLSKARKRQKKLLKDIKKAVASGDPVKIRAARHSAMKSKLFLVISAVDAEKKKPARKRHPLAELMGAAAKLSWHKLCDEPVVAGPKAKSKGGFRVYCEFGIRLRALHEALRAIYSPSLKPKAFQYDAHGNGYDGVPNAIRDIRIAIENGYVWARTLDVSKFFQNFTKDGIVELSGLDDKMVTNCALGTHLKFKPRTSPIATIAEIIDQARRGGPQGSAFSALLAQMIVSHLKWKDVTLLFNWVDNFLILGKTKEEVEVASIALISAIGGLPGGHFILNSQHAGHLADGFEFLGHHLQMTEGKLAIKPARPEDLVAAITKADAKIASYVYGNRKSSPYASQKARELLKDAWLLVKCWKTAFKECNQALVEEHTEPLFIGLKQYFADLKVSPVQINAHSNPEIKWNVHYS